MNQVWHIVRGLEGETLSTLKRERSFTIAEVDDTRVRVRPLGGKERSIRRDVIEQICALHLPKDQLRQRAAAEFPGDQTTSYIAAIASAVQDRLNNRDGHQIVYKVCPLVTDGELNDLFEKAWPDHRRRPINQILRHGHGYVCAYVGDELIGFVRLAGDGDRHAFLLDPTVDPAWRRRGIGKALVEQATQLATQAGADWLHVDHEERLEPFYAACGFRPTHAGIRRLTGDG